MSWRSMAKDLLDKQEAVPNIKSIPKTPVEAIPENSFGDYGDFGERGESVNREGVGFIPVATPDDEREAIMLCSGMPSTWAVVFSALEADRPPQGLSARHWQDRLDAILIFADQHARDLEGLGWYAGALFAIGEHWQELHHRGVGWFIAEALADGGKVTAMDERSIVYRTNRGAVRTIWTENIALV